MEAARAAPEGWRGWCLRVAARAAFTRPRSFREEGRGFGPHKSTGGGFLREFACNWNEGVWPLPNWKNGVWPGAMVGVVSPYLGGRGVAGSARCASGPARAGVRGHGGAVRGGKRCLKRVSEGTRGIAEDPARGLGEPARRPERGA